MGLECVSRVTKKTVAIALEFSNVLRILALSKHFFSQLHSAMSLCVAATGTSHVVEIEATCVFCRLVGLLSKK